LKVAITVEQPPALHPAEPGGGYYNGCLLKLLAFRMHQIDSNLKRVMVLDADQLILRSLDSLFKLPGVDLAAPRAYWNGKDALASTLMVIKPTNRLWDLVSENMRNITVGMFDMDLIKSASGEGYVDAARDSC
jgi:alpha-N-acetylglucosamine transferase